MGAESMSKSLLKQRSLMRAQMNSLGPILQGSITSMAVRCGNPNCRCAKGEKHRSICLSYRRDGKTRMFYLGHALFPKAQEWLHNYRQLLCIIRKLTDINVALLKNERMRIRRAARARRKARTKR